MIRKILFLGCLGLITSCATKTALNTTNMKVKEVVQTLPKDYEVVPQPNNIKPEKGVFVLNNQVYIIAPKNLEKEANFLKEYLKSTSGVNVKIELDKVNKNIKSTILSLNPNIKIIVLGLNFKIENKEGYILKVSPHQINIKGKTSAGVFYALQTLRQLAQNREGVNFIPAVEITDTPRFAYRGMHLDVGRHMFPVEFIKKYIDLLALHKMNKFHWHLTEDQGWRLEIKKYPKLTSVGAWRDETAVQKNFPGAYEGAKFIGDGKKYGGFYTQKEARDIVKYAADRHITVIPEIDMPGHMLAALASYPELGNGTGPYEVGKFWGVFPQILAPKEETFKFIENVLTEVMDIFPSEYIHIGGDEAPKKEWKESTQAQELIKKLGLKDDTEPSKIDGKKHSKEEKLQSYFIQRVEKFINSKGRQIIGWDEILEGGLAPNATVMSWRGEEGGIVAAKQKHNVIMTPGNYCYFDHYQTERDKEKKEPFALCCLTTVEEVYSYDPQPAQLTEDEKKYIQGAQGNVWTEYLDIPEKIEYMAVPRIGALSEVVWSKKEDKNYNNFKQRMQSFKKQYDLMNINYERTFFNQ